MWSETQYTVYSFAHVVSFVLFFVSLFVFPRCASRRRFLLFFFILFFLSFSLSSFFGFTIIKQYHIEKKIAKQAYQDNTFEQADILLDVKVKKRISKTEAEGQIVYQHQNKTNIYVGTFQLFEQSSHDTFEFHSPANASSSVDNRIDLAKVYVDKVPVTSVNSLPDTTQVSFSHVIQLNFPVFLIFLLLECFAFLSFLFYFCRQLQTPPLLEEASPDLPDSSEADPTPILRQRRRIRI